MSNAEQQLAALRLAAVMLPGPLARPLRVFLPCAFDGEHCTTHDAARDEHLTDSCVRQAAAFNLYLLIRGGDDDDDD